MKWKGDKRFLTYVLIAVVFGLVMIASVSSVVSHNNFGESYYYLKRQLVSGLLIGLILGLFGYFFPYKFWKKLSLPIFISVIALLWILVSVPGLSAGINNTKRWLMVGSFVFQPSEFAKIALVIFLSAWLSKRKNAIQKFRETFFYFLLIVVLIALPIFFQPDFGTMGLLTLIAFSMYFFAGANWRYLAGLASLGIMALLAGIKVAPYRMRRVVVFFNEKFDLQGFGYQAHQALVALGSGGWRGLGPGHSLQKFNYLPEPMGDSIFAIIGEEWGLIGALAVVALFVIISIRGFYIAKQCSDDFGKLLALGITSWFFLQAIINIGGMAHMVFLTGMPLPFISYGGSALAAAGLAVGIMLNISKEIKL